MWEVIAPFGDLYIQIVGSPDYIVGPVMNTSENRWTLKALCDYHALGYITRDWLTTPNDAFGGRPIDNLSRLADSFHQLEAGVAN